MFIADMGSEENLTDLETNEENLCMKHCWFLSTNLHFAQQCVKVCISFLNLFHNQVQVLYSSK